MILKYIVGTTSYGILYSSTKNNCLIDYIYNDFAGSMDDRKSTLGYILISIQEQSHGNPRNNPL
jgi:hypothetical protein